MRRASVVGLVLLAGCYGPTIDDGQYSCSDGRCPDGYVCTLSCKVCVKQGHPVDDTGSCLSRPDLSGAVGDLAGADLGGGPIVIDFSAADFACPSPPCHRAEGCSNNNGLRDLADPDFPRLAFCPATWTIAGITNLASQATPCNRMPMNALSCTVADNCAVGWHVCRGDADATAHGLTPMACNVNPPSGMWLTRQNGGPDDDCAMSGDNNLFGCLSGNLTGTTTTISCGVLRHDWHGSQCVAPWSCGGVDTTNEGVLVTKVDLTNGGVLCCRDL